MNASFFRASVLLLALGSVPAAICAQVLPPTAAARFEILDTNRDGVVDKSEYESNGSNGLFAKIDSNRNNRISAEELQSVLGPQEDGMPSAADRILVADGNDDGELTDEELRRAAEMRFSWLDRNSDGKLDLAEMKSGFGIPATPPHY
ncbi:EF-hand domain-containing protein [Lysobacter niabensis]|uniref:EF-hand domain-containing protein n=1 Tax=Agrilutibacter niabensis TaxID=380628 RepID=UPI003609A5AD